MLFVVYGVIIALLSVCGGLYIKSVFFSTDNTHENINQENPRLAEIRKLNNNEILSGIRIDGYNRQFSVLENRRIYGVSNKGVTMDERNIYTPKYSSIGL